MRTPRIASQPGTTPPTTDSAKSARNAAKAARRSARKPKRKASGSADRSRGTASTDATSGSTHTASPGAEKVVDDLREYAEAQLRAGKTVGLVDSLLSVIETLQNDVASKEGHIATLTRLVFGRRTERLSAEELGQLTLAFGGTEAEANAENPLVPAPDEPASTDEDEDEQPKKKRKNRPNHKGRGALSPELERNITRVLVPDADRVCKQCSRPMTTIGHVSHERVEYVPAKLVVFVEERETCACKACEGDIKTADRRDSSEVRAGASLLAHLIESKCDDSLPINRQRDQFRKLGFNLPTSTLYGYFKYATTLLAPVAAILQSIVLDADIVAIDDTRLDVLDNSRPAGKYRGHLWCFASHGALVSYGFTETWKATEVAPWISAIGGFIQCDDYGGYDTKIDRDGVVGPLVPHKRRLGCMMHVRRRFHAAYEAKDFRAGAAIELIRKLYAIERRAKDDGLDTDARLALRIEESLPILDDFGAWVDELLPLVTPTSLLGKALGYATQQREFIRRCFEDGRFEIDNGLVERTLRKACVGRRNFLFTGSADAGVRLADAYSLVQSCRGLGINPSDYLTDVIRKLQGGWPMRRIRELVPDRWAELRLRDASLVEKSAQ